MDGMGELKGMEEIEVNGTDGSHRRTNEQALKLN